MTSLPTLSQFSGYRTDHLTTGAAHGEALADSWESTFTTVKKQTFSMGWEGRGAEAAAESIHRAQVQVVGHADELRVAAGQARRAADELSYLHGEVNRVLDEARDEGFMVTESWEVIDPRQSDPLTAAAREVQAQFHAGAIKAKLGAFLAREHEAGVALGTQATDIAAVPLGMRPASFGTDTPIAPWDNPDPAPAPPPSSSNFLPQYEQSLTAPPDPAPRSGAPMPVSPPPPSTGPGSAPCRDAIQDARDELERRIAENTLKGALLGGLGGIAASDGWGAVQGVAGGGAMGGLGTAIDQATTAHPLPKECQ